MNAILTIADAARLIAAKDLSPVELTQHCFARIRAHDAQLCRQVFVKIGAARQRGLERQRVVGIRSRRPALQVRIG